MAAPGGWVKISRSFFTGSVRNLTELEQRLFLYLIVFAEYDSGHKVHLGQLTSSPKTTSAKPKPPSDELTSSPKLTPGELTSSKCNTNTTPSATLFPDAFGVAELQRGHIYTTLSQLSEGLACAVKGRKRLISRNKVHRALKKLATEHFIEHFVFTKGIVVNILNYNKYQATKPLQVGIKNTPSEHLTEQSKKPTLFYTKKGKLRKEIGGELREISWGYLCNTCKLQHLPAEQLAYLKKYFDPNDIYELFNRFCLSRKSKRIAISRIAWTIEKIMENPLEKVKAAIRKHLTRRYEHGDSRYGEWYFYGTFKEKGNAKRLGSHPPAPWAAGTGEATEEETDDAQGIPDVFELLGRRGPKRLV